MDAIIAEADPKKSGKVTYEFFTNMASVDPHPPPLPVPQAMPAQPRATEQGHKDGPCVALWKPHRQDGIGPPRPITHFQNLLSPVARGCDTTLSRQREGETAGQGWPCGARPTAEQQRPRPSRSSGAGSQPTRSSTAAGQQADKPSGCAATRCCRV